MENECKDIVIILSISSKKKGAEIIGVEICSNHEHMPVIIPPSMSALSYVE